MAKRSKSKTISEDDLLLAYLAGAIDADGHITVQRTLRKAGRQYQHRPTYYFPKMGYTSVSDLVPNLLRERFGGAVHRYRPKNPKHKPVFLWYIGTAECGRAAALLVPHLRQKRRQAEAVIKLCEMITTQHLIQKIAQKPPYRITPRQLAEREKVWATVTMLNMPTNRRVHFLPPKDPAAAME